MVTTSMEIFIACRRIESGPLHVGCETVISASAGSRQSLARSERFPEPCAEWKCESLGFPPQ